MIPFNEYCKLSESEGRGQIIKAQIYEDSPTIYYSLMINNMPRSIKTEVALDIIKSGRAKIQYYIANELVKEVEPRV